MAKRFIYGKNERIILQLSSIYLQPACLVKTTSNNTANQQTQSTSGESLDSPKHVIIKKNKQTAPFNRQHFVKYSMKAEAHLAAASNSNDTSTTTNSNTKKRSDFSGSRERLTHIRYFYADPEIDKAAERPLVRLNPMTMLYMGVSTDNSHLLQSANYLRNELPIRLAHMIKDFRNLPFIVACNPYMLEIHERCIKTFRSFDNFEREIKDIPTEKKFNQLVYEMLEMNKDLLALLCDGFKDTRRYIRNESFIKTNLNKILSARLGIRLLCEHHIALNKQSSLNKILLSNRIDDDDVPPPTPPPPPSTATMTSDSNSNQAHHDNFNSSYLSGGDGTGNGNGNGTGNGNGNGNGNSNLSSSNEGSNSTRSIHNGNLVGIIHKKFSPKSLIETSGRMVTKLCMDKYGVSPKIKIDGHTNASFPYLPLPVEYILPELLKNAFRATYEHHKASPALPDIGITIAVNEKDYVIRIRDRGGGIPHGLQDKIFDYHFTTADGESSASSANNTNKDNADDMAFDNAGMMGSAVGMICEASSSRGLAVMHGYGFGLPTSKAYAEYLGGSLTFQSMQGIGTDFYLRLGRLDIEPEMVRI